MPVIRERTAGVALTALNGRGPATRVHQNLLLGTTNLNHLQPKTYGSATLAPRICLHDFRHWKREVQQTSLPTSQSWGLRYQVQTLVIPREVRSGEMAVPAVSDTLMYLSRIRSRST